MQGARRIDDEAIRAWINPRKTKEQIREEKAQFMVNLASGGNPNWQDRWNER